MTEPHKMTDQQRENFLRNLPAIIAQIKKMTEASQLMHRSMSPVITPEQRAINSAASFGLFPNVSEEVLRREWQHYRHLEPSFRKWLELMHAERSRSSSRANAVKPAAGSPSLGLSVFKEVWPVFALLAALWTAVVILCICW